MEKRSNISGGKQGLLMFLLIILLLAIDQTIKVWVKTTMIETEMIEILSWFKIYFIENEGMAYGITIGSKLVLTLFRIVAMTFASIFLYRLIRRSHYSIGFITCLSMIVAGGIGNIIDCVFYGEIFTSSVGQISQLVPWGEGYGSVLHGKVVDMFYFPIIRTTYPDWFPMYGGEPFIFFSPIFNFADACISVGVILLLVCYPRTFTHMLDSFGTKKDETSSN